MSEYNKRNNTGYTLSDRLDPSINTRIACWELQRVMLSYQRVSAAFPSGIDLSDRRVAGLVIQGWNAGWSLLGTTGVIKHLLEAGYPASKISIYSVQKNAERYQEITHKLRRKDVVGWTNSVLNLYFRELRAPGA